MFVLISMAENSTDKNPLELSSVEKCYCRGPARSSTIDGYYVSPLDPALYLLAVYFVSIGAEYRPVPLVATPGEGLRVHILPNDFALSRDLNQSPGAAVADKSVAVGQSLCAADARAEQRMRRVAAILPDDLVGLGVQFHYS